VLTDLLELFEIIIWGMIVLLPLANPLTTAVLMLGLSKHMTESERNHQSKMTAIYVFVIMMVAYYGGQLVMHTFGISIPGLRIAGGMIVSFIGFRMLFPQQLSEDAAQNPYSKNIAFIPLAMPSTAGPGTIAMIISGATTISVDKGYALWVMTIAPVLTLAFVSLLLWVCLRSSSQIMRWVGKDGIEAVARMMGFLLVCMGVQFVINGVLEIIATHHHVMH
jgi:multiple antibiotic resistance protein